MRILQLSAGTGSFYCGNCIRDNALVAAMRRQGHDVVMAPLYLPFVLDEPSTAGDSPVFFGGVNVYLQQKSRLFRHSPRWLDRLLDAPALLRWAGRRAGMTQARDVTDLMFSMFRGEEGRQAKELDKLIDWMRQDGPFDVVSLSSVLLAGVARRLRRELGVAVTCTLQGEAPYLDALPSPHREQAWSLLAERSTDVDLFLAISQHYADLMRSRLGLAQERIAVAHGGIALEGYGPVPQPPTAPTVGYMARLCPAKGLHSLVEAFILLARRGRVAGVRLRAAGAQTAGDARFVADQRDRLSAAGLADRAEFLPNVDRAGKQEFLRGLSVLSVPATYGEAFGLYLLEAWASGVPVVQPRHGAFPELIQATGGGILCRPDDAASLAEALEELLRDPARARALGQRGREAVVERFTADHAARRVLELTAPLAGRPGAATAARHP